MRRGKRWRWVRLWPAWTRPQLELARLNLQQAQGAWDRVSWMPGASALPQGIALQQATVEYRQALAHYNLTLAGPSQEEIARAQAEVDRARAAWQQARLSLERAALVAPFSGTVTQVMVEVEQTIAPGSPVFQLMDLSSLLIELAIDEIDIARIAPGQTARVTLDALPDERFRGRIDFIAPAASLEGGVVTYPVRVRLEEDDPRLRVGMTANVEIAAQRAEGALLVPNRAIRVDREAGRLYVEKAMASGSLLVEITPGLRNESFTQVLEGLSEGDQVIIRPISGRELLQETFQFGGSR
ncbi:MAG: efflux RND transporter periplasmic adaptor subunit [Chloroflexi bacterium]|nr:efflux RND transporter periplasmic adaptor subunit [Chloroflexota bacterium]